MSATRISANRIYPRLPKFNFREPEHMKRSDTASPAIALVSIISAPALKIVVINSLIIVGILMVANSTFGQCPTFTFSASPGQNHREIKLTIGGQINGTATVEMKDSGGVWRTQFTTIVTGDFVRGPFGHNSTLEFRAQNGGSCTGWIEASATTLDVGHPWLNVWPGTGNTLNVQSGGINPDMNSQIMWSTNGDTFSSHSVWERLPQNGVDPPINIPISPNHTYYFYARIFLDANVIRRTPVFMVRLSPDQDLGSCTNPWTISYVPSSMLGKPVNAINGNMYLSQTDYRLPGLGRSIDLTRSYNSQLQAAGLFGFGWTTEYDQYLTHIDSKNIRLQMPDGRAVYFARETTASSFSGITPGYPGEIVANGDGTFTLNLKDGRSNKFSSAGKLLQQKDRNNNQTTINYDTNGVLTGVTDASGRTLTITIGSNGFVSQVSDSLGVIADYEYFSATNFLKAVTYLDGSKFQFEYDTTAVPGKTFLKTVKDALNNVVETHLYDSDGRATTSEIHGGHEKYTFNYSNSSFTSVTDGVGRVTKYHFDRTNARNVVKKIEGVCGCGGGGSETTEYFYDSNLNLVKQTDALARDTTYAYDSNLNTTSITDVFGTQTFTYNGFGQVLTYKDRVDSSGSNSTAVFTYDANANLLTATDALGKTTTLVYPTTNNKGLPDSVTDARSKITKFKWFSGSGLLQEIEDANGKKTNFTYDARGRTNTVTNPLGHVTDYNYFDDTQRKVEMIYPNLDKITYKYDIRRTLESVTDERGKVTTYEFDPAYRLKKITDPLNHVKEFGYDAMSFMTSYIDPLGNVTNYVPDDFGRLKEIEYPAATSGGTRLKEKFFYDKTGRITKHTDSANRDTIFAYNDVTRTNTITNPENEVTTTKYDLRFNTTEVKDALNQTYTFGYDAMGRLLSQTRAGGSMSFVYDNVGNHTKRTDYAGRVTNYIYDNLNRLEKVEYEHGSGGSITKQISTYVYDDLSRLLSATNDSGTVSFGYDNRNRLTSTTDVFGQVLSYEYERTTGVNQKRVKLNGTLYATYNYDNAERLSNIVNASDSSTITFGYDNEDKLTSRVYPNGVTTTYEYFDDDKLKRLKDFTTSATHFDRQYTYNSANQISSITDASGTRTFGYDLMDRLTSVTGAANESYTFDDVGNRTASHLSSTYGYQTGQFNRLSSTTSATYGFDANGNTTSKSEGSNFWRYSWDHENRLVSAATRKLAVKNKFDALGRRIERDLGFGRERTRFTYDGTDSLVEDNKGAITKFLNGVGIDNKLSAKTSSTALYFLADHLGSTNGLTDSSGAMTSQTAYDAFGNPTGNLATSYQFTGREYDSFSGFYYYRARFYDPKLGRFISEDPIGLTAGDVNLYSYVSNNPIRFSDPSGKQRADRDRPGDMYPGMREPYDPRRAGQTTMPQDMSRLACAADGLNPWITLELGGAIQFGPLGGADAVVVALNPLTMELVIQTKLMSGMGGSTGILATGGAQIGISFGPSEGSRAGGPSAELFVDAAGFGGGSGSINVLGGFGSGVGVGGVIGGGAGGGLRIGESNNLFIINAHNCHCKK